MRRKFLEQSPHFCKSVEELLERQATNRTSLGIIIPESITDCSIELKSELERHDWQAKEEARQQQERLVGSKPKPLAFPEANFFVHWQCKDKRCKGKDKRCKGHKMSLHQWGIHELYRKYKDKPDGKEKVIQAMRKHLDESERDIFMFLGNFRSLMYKFGLMDSYSAPARPREQEFSLFS